MATQFFSKVAKLGKALPFASTKARGRTWPTIDAIFLMSPSKIETKHQWTKVVLTRFETRKYGIQIVALISVRASSFMLSVSFSAATAGIKSAAKKSITIKMAAHENHAMASFGVCFDFFKRCQRVTSASAMISMFPTTSKISRGAHSA